MLKQLGCYQDTPPAWELIKNSELQHLQLINHKLVWQIVISFETQSRCTSRPEARTPSFMIHKTHSLPATLHDASNTVLYQILVQHSSTIINAAAWNGGLVWMPDRTQSPSSWSKRETNNHNTSRIQQGHYIRLKNWINHTLTLINSRTRARIYWLSTSACVLMQTVRRGEAKLLSFSEEDEA